MNENREMMSAGRRGFRVAAGIAAVLVAGALFSWWMAVRTDRELRADLLQQARLVAQGLDIERVRMLSGTKADLDDPAYLHLKK